MQRRESRRGGETARKRSAEGGESAHRQFQQVAVAASLSMAGWVERLLASMLTETGRLVSHQL